MKLFSVIIVCCYKYQLSLINYPRDGIVPSTELDDQCDKLVVDRRSSIVNL